MSYGAKAHYKSMSDLQLVALCQKESHEAFTVLMERHKHLIAAKLWLYAPDWSDHGDFKQEILIRVWRSIKLLRNPYAFQRWLNQLIKHLFYDALSARNKTRLVSMDEPNEENGPSLSDTVKDTRPTPHEEFERAELMNKIVTAVDELPSDFRRILILRDFEGRPYNEIADIVGVELGTAKSRISRARHRVQLKLQNYLAS